MTDPKPAGLLTDDDARYVLAQHQLSYSPPYFGLVRAVALADCWTALRIARSLTERMLGEIAA